MAGKQKAMMEQLSNQIIRFVEGVRREGGIRRIVLEFPESEVSAPVVVVVLRKEDYESIGEPDSGKGPHAFIEQMMVQRLCGWCGQPEQHPSHGAVLKVVDFPNG